MRIIAILNGIIILLEILNILLFYILNSPIFAGISREGCITKAHSRAKFYILHLLDSDYQSFPESDRRIDHFELLWL